MANNSKTIPYDIFSYKAPIMPKCSKGTEFVKLVGSQFTKSMRETLIPMVMPAMAAYLVEVKFEYSDGKQYEMSGQMGHLIGTSGIGKAQLGHVVEAIMRDFREHDLEQYNRLVEWQRKTKTSKANERKPERPEAAFWFPPADMTNPAFIQNAMAMEKDGNRTQYLNLPEIEMANRLCGGHSMMSPMIRNIYDCQRAGALRATADGVSGNPVLRVCLTFTSTPEAARKFYRRDLTNGFFGRIPFAFKAREARSGRIPRLGKMNEAFLGQLDTYIKRLSQSKGVFKVAALNKVADELAEEMAAIADLADDDMLFELSHRSIFAAWKKGCVLWLLNNQTWSKSIADFMKWFCYFDLWSKIQVFGDLFHNGEEAETDSKNLPKNMLDDLPGTFNENQLIALRQKMGKKESGTKHQLQMWVYRGHVTFDPETQYYSKTMGYLDGSLRTREAKHGKKSNPKKE